MTKREMTKMFKEVIKKNEGERTEDETFSVYLGSFMSIDPCGRYHHILSENGITNKCELFWERLDDAASLAGGYIESGEGDPTDIFFCYSICA